MIKITIADNKCFHISVIKSKKTTKNHNLKPDELNLPNKIL